VLLQVQVRVVRPVRQVDLARVAVLQLVFASRSGSFAFAFVFVKAEGVFWAVLLRVQRRCRFLGLVAFRAHHLLVRVALAVILQREQVAQVSRRKRRRKRC